MQKQQCMVSDMKSWLTVMLNDRLMQLNMQTQTRMVTGTSGGAYIHADDRLVGAVDSDKVCIHAAGVEGQH